MNMCRLNVGTAFETVVRVDIPLGQYRKVSNKHETYLACGGYMRTTVFDAVPALGLYMFNVAYLKSGATAAVFSTSDFNTDNILVN